MALHIADQVDYLSLLPIFDALRDDHWPLFSPDMKEIAEFGPDSVLTVSSRLSGFRAILPSCPVIQIPKLAARRPESLLRASAADAVGAVNDEEQQAFLDTGLSRNRVLLTGLPLMDPVFGGDLRRRRGIGTGRMEGRERGGKGSRKTVLYMPDWRRGISAEPAVKEALVKLCQARNSALDVVVRPHPQTLAQQQGWVDGWVDLAASYSNLTVHVRSGVNHLSLMADADLLLADFSALAFTFMAFDAPMVLVRPRADASPQHRLSERQEGLMERAATCLDAGSDIAAQVLQSLDHPDANDESRARMRSAVFGGGADGRAAIRTVSLVRAFLDA